MENGDPLKQQGIDGLLSEAVADYVLGMQLKLHEDMEQRKRKN